MTVSNPPKKPPSKSAVYWKNKHDKQVFLVNSMKSLLNRYGSSIDLDSLYSAFLLTLMGQFVVSDACYYAPAPGSNKIKPALAYGKRKKELLPGLVMESDLIRSLVGHRLPQRLGALPPEVIANKEYAVLSSVYDVVAPLFLKEKLIGVLWLGKKISSQDFRSEEFEVLYALCAVSAAAFNNAVLYRNAKHSAQEIQRLHDVRTEVISRISHEFRTPLTIIKAGTEMLARDAKHKELCRIFSDSEARLEVLINSLLSLSEGSVHGESIPVLTDPIKILHEAVQYYSTIKTGKKINFILNQSSGLLRPALRIQEKDMRAILDALLENAIKFSRAESTVSIEIGRSQNKPQTDRDGLQLPEWRQQTEKSMEEYNAAAPIAWIEKTPASKGQNEPEVLVLSPVIGDFLVIRISDNGIGIPEADIPTIAEPFRQASNSPDRGVKGSGLGLALVHKIVSGHGGYFCCKSEEGRGTTFSVFLPIEQSVV